MVIPWNKQHYRMVNNQWRTQTEPRESKAEQMKTTVLVKVLTPSLAACVLLGLVGCATPTQVTQGQQSGFLRDYSLLRQGVGKEANYLYINKEADWASYTNIWLKPIELWHSADPESPLGKLSEESQQMLLNSFYAAMYEALAKDHQMVDHGGPGVLVIRSALTDGRSSQPVPNLTSKGYLPLKVASWDKRLLAGVDLGVGKGVIEADFTDGQTGKRVAAAMDARPGAMALSGRPPAHWEALTVAYDWWAQRWNKRLSLMKKGDFRTIYLQ
jgi:hypothetical protein